MTVRHSDRGPIHPAGPGALGEPRRLAPITPGVYQEDPLFLAWCDALDELLGPFTAALDCFAAYLDPQLAPPDFVGWLGELAGLEPEDLRAPADLLRARVADAVASHDRRGTVTGLREAAARAADVPVGSVELVEPGCVVWSAVAGAAAVPAAGGGVRIVVHGDLGPDRQAACLATARAAVPVQYQVHVEVMVSHDRLS